MTREKETVRAKNVMLLDVSIRDLGILVQFGVVNELSVDILVETSFINHYVHVRYPH